MLHGVKINGTNTLDEYGLMVLADISIGAPERKTNYVDIPGADGALDFSDLPLGRPTYKNRTVSFKLFKSVDDAALRVLRSTLMNSYHGKEVEVLLPDDEDQVIRHYFKGVLSVGQMTGYNTGIIPITVYADPYRYKEIETTVTKTLTTTPKTILLENEMRPVIPTVTVDKETTILFNGNSFTLAAGEHKVIGLELQEGENAWEAASNGGSIEITYREACF